MATTSANWPIPLPPVSLPGKVVRLESLVPEHEPELLRICADERIWRYLTSYGGSPEAMHRYFEVALHDYRAGMALPFVIRSIFDQHVVGMTRLKNLSREHRNALIGSWLAPCAWGTGANTQSKLLLLEYAFAVLGCIRLEFHTDSRNLRSRNALAKLGACQEGILRSCVITRDGGCRDTVVFGMLASEWPGAKRCLEMRLEAQRAFLNAGSKW